MKGTNVRCIVASVTQILTESLICRAEFPLIPLFTPSLGHVHSTIQLELTQAASMRLDSVLAEASRAINGLPGSLRNEIDLDRQDYAVRFLPMTVLSFPFCQKPLHRSTDVDRPIVNVGSSKTSRYLEQRSQGAANPMSIDDGSQLGTVWIRDLNLTCR